MPLTTTLLLEFGQADAIEALVDLSVELQSAVHIEVRFSDVSSRLSWSVAGSIQ